MKIFIIYFDNIDIFRTKKKLGKKPTKQFFVIKSVLTCIWKFLQLVPMNWFWKGACKSAGEREWPAPGHDKNHGERHHRMLYSVTEKGWREEKWGT